MAKRASRPFWLPLLWRGLGASASLPLRLHLAQRCRQGREDKARIGERRGLTQCTRPAGPLLWFHAASVGETRAAFPLLSALLEAQPALQLLMTTATRTGAETLKLHESYGTRLHHQYLPLDVPWWIQRFLNTWQPQGAVFVESELWPGLLEACRQRTLPVMLVNGRLSERSVRRWQAWPRLANWVFGSLSWVSPATPEDGARFQQLKVGNVFPPFDLKKAAPVLPCSAKELAVFQAHFQNRPVFVAASTHQGEEEIILEALKQARRHHPNLLGILAPRHPERCSSLQRSHPMPRRTQQPLPAPEDKLWMLDTLGELGLFYRLANAVFIGNSLLPPGGGHNPYEAVRLQKPTAVGPWTGAWKQTCAALELPVVSTAKELGDWIQMTVQPTSAFMPPGACAHSPATGLQASQQASQHAASLKTLAHRILTTIPPYFS